MNSNVSQEKELVSIRMEITEKKNRKKRGMKQRNLMNAKVDFWKRKNLILIQLIEQKLENKLLISRIKNEMIINNLMPISQI